jgi:hypothetical protein
LSDPGFLGLVRKHIRSVWALELVLLLRRRPDAVWRTENLVRELRASTPLIADNLRRLQASGLVAEDQGVWRWAPATPDLERFCNQLAEAYQTRPVTVINMIAAPNPVQDLADAFNFNSDKSKNAPGEGDH